MIYRKLEVRSRTELARKLVGVRLSKDLGFPRFGAASRARRRRKAVMTRYVVELYRPELDVELPARGSPIGFPNSAAEAEGRRNSRCATSGLDLPARRRNLPATTRGRSCEADVRGVAELAAIDVDRVIPGGADRHGLRGGLMPLVIGSPWLGPQVPKEEK